MLKRKEEELSVPALHIYMINAGVVVLVASGIAFYFAPPEKAAAFSSIMTTAIGFLVGKFTNGFKRDDKKPGE